MSLLLVCAEFHDYRTNHAKAHGEQARDTGSACLGIIDITLHGRPGGATMLFRPGRSNPAFFV